MKHINEFNTFTGQEVANHIEYITPDSSDIPDHFIDKYILPNNGWKNKSIKLKDLLKDRDFKEYYKSGEELKEGIYYYLIDPKSTKYDYEKISLEKNGVSGKVQLIR